jgi:glycosyltransferase involved in cell wall biosynthesis
VRISIVTPSYRRSAWLRLCIASVADQRVEVEHIVQDAESDDGTLDWLPGDRRVKMFVEEDQGMYDGINRGLRRAGGDILAYLNCDEQYLPGALAAVAGFFEQHPQMDVLFGDVVMVDTEGRYLYHRKMQTPLKYHTWTCHLSTLFTCTGANMSIGPNARRENRELFLGAPFWARAIKPLFILQHRLRRWAGGIYRQEPFAYEIFTLASPDRRRRYEVSRPTFRAPR